VRWPWGLGMASCHHQRTSGARMRFEWGAFAGSVSHRTRHAFQEPNTPGVTPALTGSCRDLLTTIAHVYVVPRSTPMIGPVAYSMSAKTSWLTASMVASNKRGIRMGEINDVAGLGVVSALRFHGVVRCCRRCLLPSCTESTVCSIVRSHRHEGTAPAPPWAPAPAPASEVWTAAR
jgi:hypothetical protein